MFCPEELLGFLGTHEIGIHFICKLKGRRKLKDWECLMPLSLTYLQNRHRGRN